MPLKLESLIIYHLYIHIYCTYVLVKFLNNNSGKLIMMKIMRESSACRARPRKTIALEPGRKKSCAFPFMVPPKDHVSTPVNISESLKYTHELAPKAPCEHKALLPLEEHPQASVLRTHLSANCFLRQAQKPAGTALLLKLLLLLLFRTSNTISISMSTKMHATPSGVMTLQGRGTNPAESLGLLCEPPASLDHCKQGWSTRATSPRKLHPG